MNNCDVCKIEEGVFYIPVLCSEEKIYFCKECLDKRNSNVEKMLEKGDVSSKKQMRESGIKVFDRCICGAKLKRDRFFRVHPNLCVICSNKEFGKC